jgi:hypothetical protein
LVRSPRSMLRAPSPHSRLPETVRELSASIADRAARTASRGRLRTVRSRPVKSLGPARSNAWWQLPMRRPFDPAREISQPIVTAPNRGPIAARDSRDGGRQEVVTQAKGHRGSSGRAIDCHRLNNSFQLLAQIRRQPGERASGGSVYRADAKSTDDFAAAAPRNHKKPRHAK